ncbi:MAG: hypothetical protein IT328_17945 [Caldilineaceae bacterium]|nr:hypothetical protein [Caldilineaceae bacterium]
MRSKLILFLNVFALTLGLSACSLVITPMPPPQRSPNGVIFSAEQSAEVLPWLMSQAEGAWTPTDADVAALEADLLPFLHTAEHPWLRPEPPIWERVPDYRRQYLGMIENGEQVIYANFFCDANIGDWQQEFVLVNDGGDCFFQVKYNPATGEFYDFSVNGEA